MPTVKLVVIGASGVGKTGLRGKYISGRFSNGYRATIGADFITKKLPHPSNSDPDQSVTLQIWDTAGQERFSSLSTAFFRGADAVLLMFDVNTPETMFALKKWWNNFCYQPPVAEEDVEEYPCVVVGNKIDRVGAGGSSTSISESEALVFLEELTPPSSSINIIPPARPVDNEDATPSQAAPLPSQSPPPNPRPEPPTRSDTITINPLNHQFRQPSSSPSHHLAKSRSRSSSRFYSGTMTTTHTTLTIYHTPSSYVFDLYQSARSSPEPPPWSGSEPMSPSASVRQKRRLTGLSTGSTSSGSAVTITPSLFARSNAASATGATTPEEEPTFSSSLGLSAHPPDLGPKLFFTSAKTGEGVEDVFRYIAQRVLRKWEYDDLVETRRLGFRESGAVGEAIRLGLDGSGSGSRKRNRNGKGWDGCCSS